MNPTDKPIHLSPRTPIGLATPVTVNSVCQATSSSNQQSLLTIAEVRSALEAKSISLADTALKGQDLDNLITLLVQKH
jgi:DNA-binding FadR family transcriptional regulator